MCNDGVVTNTHTSTTLTSKTQAGRAPRKSQGPFPRQPMPPLRGSLRSDYSPQSRVPVT